MNGIAGTPLNFNFNLNATNNYKNTITLLAPIENYNYYQILATQYFVVKTNIGTTNFYVDLNDPNAQAQPVFGLAEVGDLILNRTNTSLISTLSIELFEPTNPEPGVAYQGILQFQQ